MELTRRASGTGVAATLVVTPYYNRPSQQGLEAHFRAVAGASDLPMLVYDIPVRAGRKVGHEVLVRLAREVPNVVGVKDAALDVAGSARLWDEVPESFEIYSGNDDQTLPLLAVGAVGVIGVATHWAGLEVGEMITAFFKGDVERARALNARLLASYEFETGEATPNPLPAKAMMRTLGLGVGQCRPPMGPAPEGLEDRARSVLADLRANLG
jgi:4-hydroxy-tetrahydrodipicolinate synthase